MHHLLQRTALIWLALLVFGCGDEADENDGQENPGEPEMTPQEEACLHIANDTPLQRSATSDREGADDDISRTHSVFQIALPDGAEDEYEGYVRYDIEEADTYLLFTSSELPVTFFDAAGEELDADADDVEECPQLTTQHTVELNSGDHFVRFGPWSEDEVFTVSETAGDVH